MPKLCEARYNIEFRAIRLSLQLSYKPMNKPFVLQKRIYSYATGILIIGPRFLFSSIMRQRDCHVRHYLGERSKGKFFVGDQPE